jgi:uncharacterized protein (UPF0297 family)
MRNDNSSDSSGAMKKVNQWLGGQEKSSNGENSNSPNASQEARNRLDPNPSDATSVTDVMVQKDTYSTPKNPIADTIFERLQTLAQKVGKQKDNITKIINENGDVTIITEVAGYKISGNNVEIMNYSTTNNEIKNISANELIRDLNKEIEKPKMRPDKGIHDDEKPKPKMIPDKGIMGVFDQLREPQHGSFAHSLINGKLSSNNGKTRL